MNAELEQTLRRVGWLLRQAEPWARTHVVWQRDLVDGYSGSPMVVAKVATGRSVLVVEGEDELVMVCMGAIRALVAEAEPAP